MDREFRMLRRKEGKDQVSFTDVRSPVLFAEKNDPTVGSRIADSLRE